MSDFPSLPRSRLRLQAVALTLTFVVAGLSSFGHGFKPEIYIYLDSGAALYFNQSQPDLAPYKTLLDKSVYYNICVRGLWSGFYKANYTNFFRPFPNIDGSGEDLSCGSYYIDKNLGSFRSLGPSEASIVAITLYSGEYGSGEEIIVTSATFTGITIQVISMVATGKSDWTLYEGQNLNGNSTCFTGPQDSHYFHFVGGIPLSKIGSVRKGCGSPFITMYY